MKIYCCCCAKQVVKDFPPRNSQYTTKFEGSRAGFHPNEVFCGYCAEEMDENGLFPEEREIL